MNKDASGPALKSRSKYPVIVVGTRAQLIKMAPVLRELESRELEFRLVFTGQHLDTMQAILDDFQIRTEPLWLGRKREINTLWKMAFWFPKALWQLAVSRRKLLKDPDGRPALVMVHGDTLSTLVGALAGRVNRSLVAHVESGLRSFSFRDPFPEEITRLAVFLLTHVAFCPGQWAVDNLARYKLITVDTKANTLLDAVRHATRDDAQNGPQADSSGGCVVSIHRHENLSSRSRMAWILNTVRDIAQSYHVDFVLHPSTAARLSTTAEFSEIAGNPGIRIHDRMGYLSFMALLSRADFALTDGGSNQEELSYLGVPTLIARERSERPEGLGKNAELLPMADGISWNRKLEEIRQRGLARELDDIDVNPSQIIARWLLQSGTAS